MRPTRFPMRLDGLWRAPLLVLGATPGQSYVDVTDSDIHFRLGFAFDRTFPRDDVLGADRRGWPWWMGFGLRTNFRGLVGLIGSQEGVVEVLLRNKSRAWGVISYDRIAVSVQDPDGLVSALGGEA